MNILVTGGAGFIGSNLVDELIRRGHHVAVIDNLSTGKMRNINPEARFYLMDIGDPRAEAVFRDEKIEVLSHHAAQIDVRHSVAAPRDDARTNIAGFLNLLECGMRQGLKKVVFASSGGVIYGQPEQLPATEEFPKGPLSPYGVSKLTSEYYLYYFARIQGLHYVALRYANVYGPRQDPHGEAGVVAIFGLKMLAGETPVIFGSGDQVRDYVFVGDIVRANLNALNWLERNQSEAVSLDQNAFNIGTGKGTTVNQLFESIKDISGFTGEPRYGPERAGELHKIFLAVAKASEELKWEPQVDLRQGLEWTLESLSLERGG